MKLELSYEIMFGCVQKLQMNKSFVMISIHRSSIKNDYCGGKLGFLVSQLGLLGSVGLGLGLVMSLGLGLWVRVSVSINRSGDKPVYRCNSHFRCYCGGIYRCKSIVHCK